jgi:hypothetical protein
VKFLNSLKLIEKKFKDIKKVFSSHFGETHVIFIDGDFYFKSKMSKETCSLTRILLFDCQTKAELPGVALVLPNYHFFTSM